MASGYSQHPFHDFFNPLQDNYLNDLLAHAEARGAEFILCVYTALFRHGRAVPGYRVV